MGENTQFEDFYLDNYLISLGKKEPELIDITKDRKDRFIDVCNAIKGYFENEWEIEQEKHSVEIILERQKRAIIGYTKEVSYFKDKISEYLKDNHLIDTWFPEWYPNLVEAIFNENWGFAGISEWFNSEDPKLKYSSSAKVIGDRIYYLIEGQQVLQQQTITKERRRQLRKALLLREPKRRDTDKYAEVFMLDGTRITIYGDELTVDDQDVIVFRKYVIPEYTFEKQAETEMIPEEAIPLFKSMVKLGFNVAFTGAVRTAKTTFLQTWQSYEDPTLEGVLIESNPEIPIHQLMPTAPIARIIVSDEDELNGIVKPLMRSDADYLMLGEARDGIELNLAVRIANKGTRRNKITYHMTDPTDFAYDIAREIFQTYGGNEEYHAIKVTKAFQYIFHFVQLKDKSKKRLKSLYELRYNLDRTISMHPICLYDHKKNSWSWDYTIGKTVKSIANEEEPEEFELFTNQLKHLAEKFPMGEVK